MAGNFHNEGRVEVYTHGQWGSICNRGWTQEDAKVACKQLGYGDAYNFRPYAPTRSYGAVVTMSEVSCSGDEVRLKDCAYITSSACDPLEGVEVVVMGCAIPGISFLVVSTYR